MAYLEKLIINGASYDLADSQLREAHGEMKTANEKLAEDISLLQTAQEGLQAADERLGESVSQLQTTQTEMQAVDERQQEALSLLQETLAAMKIIDTAAGESLHLPDSAAGKLLGLKAYVFASQAGEGVPSATNIRPISPMPATVTVGVADNAEMDGAIHYESCQLPENMYGGYFDWNRGVFVQTHGYVVVDGSKGTFYQSGSKSFYIANAIDYRKPSQPSTGDLQTTGICDSFVYGREKAGRVLYCSGPNVWFNNISDCATTDALKAYLQETPACIVYPLLEPVEHVIENAPALAVETHYPETFLDTTGDKLEVTYVASPKGYIDKKIKEAANENL